MLTKEQEKMKIEFDYWKSYYFGILSFIVASSIGYYVIPDLYKLYFAGIIVIIIAVFFIITSKFINKYEELMASFSKKRKPTAKSEGNKQVRSKKDNWRNTIITITIGFVLGIIGTSMGAFLTIYFDTSSPALFLESQCKDVIPKYAPHIAPEIRNRGDVLAYGSFCIEGQDVVFPNAGNQSKICWAQQAFSQMSSEIVSPFPTDFYFKESVPPSNFTLKMYSDCSLKIWIFQKPCEGIIKICTYKDNGGGYYYSST